MKHLVSYQRKVDKGKLNAVASLKAADVSSVCPSSEQSGGLWVVCVFLYIGKSLYIGKLVPACNPLHDVPLIPCPYKDTKIKAFFLGGGGGGSVNRCKN